MNKHELKILPEYFRAIETGEKTFEMTYLLDNPACCKEGYVIMAIKVLRVSWI